VLTRIASAIRLRPSYWAVGRAFEEVADILGNSPEIVRKHYGKWSVARQSRIDALMQRVYIGGAETARGKARVH
jgi:hypothetical protein